jgi:carotenoid 1,2-hydratase
MAIVIIALLGNPFSPGYARARTRGPASALGFCSMNVALYGRRASAWTLQESVVTEPERSSREVAIGRSGMVWEDDRLTVTIDERTSPMGRPVRGKVVLHAEAFTGLELTIDEREQHRWWPVAPIARIEVDLPLPGARFSGHGYHDANAGEVPLEATFETWNWSRARAGSSAVITYDVACSSGAERSLALRVCRNGQVDPLEHTRRSRLGRTAWRLERHARVDEGHDGRVVRSLEDGPFYARALVHTRLDGGDTVAMHETLAAHRLRSALVRFFTAFRMTKGRRAEPA